MWCAQSTHDDSISDIISCGDEVTIVLYCDLEVLDSSTVQRHRSADE